MEKVRLGIIGYGNQGGAYGKFIAQGLVPSMVVGAVTDIDESKDDKIKGDWPDVPIYRDYKEMIDSGNVDAVVTTLPHYLHPEVSMYALGKGIHVLNEKPAGVYTKQVKELNEFAEAHKDKATYAIMFNQRNNPLYQKIKAIVDNGDIGDIRSTNWIITTWWRPTAYYESSDWRATWGEEGGGVLVNQVPHQLDLIQWIAGVPEKVFAKLNYGYQRDIAVEDDVTVLLDYGNGATGVIRTCTHDVLGTDRLEIFGDKGKIIVENSNKATVYRMDKTEQEVDKNLGPEQQAKIFSGQLAMDSLYDLDVEVIEEKEDDAGWGVQHSGVLENFAQHILNGTELIAPGSEGIKGVRLANAIHLSDWLNEEVSLVDFDDDLYLAELNKRIAEEGIAEPKK